MSKAVMSSRTKKRIGILLRLGFYVLLAAVILLTIGGVISKYVYSNDNHSSIIASEFYFESDLLTTEGPTYELATDTGEITFTIKNYPDNLRYAMSDITYTVTVQKNSETPETKETGTLTGGAASEEKITLNLENGSTYLVTVVGNSGFKKALSATFTVRGAQKYLYKSLENYYEYVDLTVWAENVSGPVTVTFPKDDHGVIPNNMDDAVGYNVKTTDGQLTDTTSFTDVYSSHKYRFYKPYPGTPFTANNFTVTCVDTATNETYTATVKTPDK